MSLIRNDIHYQLGSTRVYHKSKLTATLKKSL